MLGGAFIFGPVVTQMFSKNALRGKAHLSLLVPCAAERSSAHCSLSSGRPAWGLGGGLGLRPAGRRRWRERHAQIRADDVDDGLAVCRVVLGEPFECVQAAQPDRGLVAAELLDRLGVQ